MRKTLLALLMGSALVFAACGETDDGNGGGESPDLNSPSDMLESPSDMLESPSDMLESPAAS